MPPLVIPNGIMVRVGWTIRTRTANNILGATPSGAVTINQALADSLDAAIKASFTSSGLAAVMPTGTSVAFVGVRDVRQANWGEFIGTSPAVFGTAAGDMLPNAVAFCVTLRTQFAGRSFRGRVFLPAGTEGFSDQDGKAHPAFATAAVDFVNAIRANFLANGLTMAVLSRPEPGRTLVPKVILPRTGGATPVIAAESRGLNWESQRRRRGNIP